MNGRVTVAYCSNVEMAQATRVSICALLNSARHERAIDLHLVMDGWANEDLDRLKIIIDKSEKDCRLTVHEADLSIFTFLPTLHGDRTTYARLLLGDIIGGGRIVYVDADTLPLLDVGDIYAAELNENIMGAVSWNVTVDTALDREVLVGEGVDGSRPYYNAGVLVIDADRYRDGDVLAKCLSVGRRLSGRLPSVDQTLINIVLRDRIAELPWRFNVRLGPNAKPYTGRGLAHFVGRFKPWDPLGLILHRNAPLWYHWAEEAGESTQLEVQRILRFISLGTTYVDTVRRRLGK